MPHLSRQPDRYYNIQQLQNETNILSMFIILAFLYKKNIFTLSSTCSIEEVAKNIAMSNDSSETCIRFAIICSIIHRHTPSDSRTPVGLAKLCLHTRRQIALGYRAKRAHCSVSQQITN